jgi:hypothetical protein
VAWTVVGDGARVERFESLAIQVWFLAGRGSGERHGVLDGCVSAGHDPNPNESCVTPCNSPANGLGPNPRRNVSKMLAGRRNDSGGVQAWP